MHALNTLTLVTLLVLAVAWDLRTRRIPNALTLTGILVALALDAAAGWDPFMDGLAGAGIALALTFPLVLLGGLGGGDAKLLAAVGAFLGREDLFTALLVTALVGGVMAIAMAIRRGALGQVLADCGSLVTGLVRSGMPGATVEPAAARRTIHTPGVLAIPYGVAIGVGALAGWLV